MKYPYVGRGFTIVELLVVVVVIAVLASVTVVGYTGVTTQAKNAQTLSAVQEHAKLLVAYHAKNGSWPISANVCFGVSPCGRMSGSGADPCDLGQGQPTSANPLPASLLDASGMTTMPMTSDQSVQCVSGDFRGSWYWGDANQRRITYYLAGDQDCLQLSGSRLTEKRTSGNATACVSQF